MPEYIYLLEKRLSDPQKNALHHVREAARDAGMTVFLAGGAVRDLTTGSSVRDLDFTVQGNALELESALVAGGATLWGRAEATRTLYVWYPGSVRVEVSSARSERFPKPGKPEYTWSGIIDDLFRRDFTANAMALSLNEGSYALLLDPLNGVADIESRQLRLVSNYGFLEDPSRLIRAVRLQYRLGWQMEERTAARFENARLSDSFESISPFLRGYEIEKIAAEEDAYGVMQALEAGGWLGKLFPDWTLGSVDTGALENLHRNRIQLLMQAIVADLTAVHLEVLTAHMKAPAREQLKAALVRPGLREQWEALEASAKEFGRRITGKEAATPSAGWNLFHTAPAEPILWLAHSRKGAAVEARFRDLFTVWPEAAKKVPVALMLEMRITPDLPAYEELLHAMFLRQIDGLLETDEQMRAFLEPYSPPAPPPPVSVRRTRGKKAGKRKDAVRDERDDGDEDDDDTPARGRSEDDEEDEDERDDEEEHSDGEIDAPAAAAPAPAPLAAKKMQEPPAQDQPAPVVAAKQPAAASGKPEPQAAPAEAGPLKAVATRSAPIQPAAVTPMPTGPAAKAAPVKTAPVKAAPVKTMPVKTASVKAGPVKAGPVKAGPPPSPPAKSSAPAKVVGKTADRKAKPAAEKSTPAKQIKAKPAQAKHAKPVRSAPKKQAPAAKKAAAPAKKTTSAKPAAKSSTSGHAVKVPAKKAPAKAAKKAVVRAAKKKSRR